MARLNVLTLVCFVLLNLPGPRVKADHAVAPPLAELIRNTCLDCHSGSDPTAGLDLDSALESDIAADTGLWERVTRKLRARQMPPAGSPRPSERQYEAALEPLVMQLDALAARAPRPGRTATFRRLTRTEYQYAIRDLLAVDIDASSLLPADDSSHGFDNITVGELSPTLLNRYVSAAQKISRLAIGMVSQSPDVATFRIPPDVTQEERMDGLPLGTRGGMRITHHFPQDGMYEIQVRLARDRNEQVEGLSEPHELEVLLDRDRVELFRVQPPRAEGGDGGWYSQAAHENVDRHLQTRFAVTAGPHEIGVTFLKKPSSLLETARQPLNVHFNMYRHPRIGPAVYQVVLTGPFDPTGPGDTASRRRIFVCRPSAEEDEEACARQIVAGLLRRAVRRPVTDADLEQPMALYHRGRTSGDFEHGIQWAISGVLLHPEFLFRVERDPQSLPSGAVYQLGDLEIASRLSFFLWSSIPDDELLELAEQERLRDPEVLRQQTLRMLSAPKARALATNFAGQWLHLRNLESITPDGRLYPDFDDNLRQAFREETERLFAGVVQEDRSVLDLLSADYTYLNERLARHYGIPHVHGSRFRQVPLVEASRRGGLLRQGSILTVTSYATRTSPVLRGKWVLENLLGTPPPPPPPDVPALEENTVAADLSVRQRLAQHRANPACASCHDLIDPVGFALEHFDAVGRWRELEQGAAIDAAGGLPDGRSFVGVDGLEQGLLQRPELFAGTLAEKLLTYALGRGLETHDAPAVRKIVRSAALNDYRFSSIVMGIVTSTPFQMRETE